MYSYTVEFLYCGHLGIWCVERHPSSFKELGVNLYNEESIFGTYRKVSLIYRDALILVVSLKRGSTVYYTLLLTLHDGFFPLISVSWTLSQPKEQ